MLKKKTHTHNNTQKWIGQNWIDQSRFQLVHSSTTERTLLLVVLGVEICGRWSVETQPFELIGTRTGVFFEAFVEEPFGLRCSSKPPVAHAWRYKFLVLLHTILAQVGCDAVSPSFQESYFCIFASDMVRRGWSQISNGWVQLIKGPRPKSVQTGFKGRQAPATSPLARSIQTGREFSQPRGNR